MTAAGGQAGAAAAQGKTQAAAQLHPRSGLIAGIERIVGRSLTTEEVVHWQKIQDVYGVSDDDPLVMVIILLGIHQHLYNDVPEKIRESVDKALHVHRTTLEDQATIVAKGLIAQLAPMFASAARTSQPEEAGAGWFSGWRERLLWAGLGLGCSLLGVILGHVLSR